MPLLATTPKPPCRATSDSSARLCPNLSMSLIRCRSRTTLLSSCTPHRRLPIRPTLLFMVVGIQEAEVYERSTRMASGNAVVVFSASGCWMWKRLLDNNPHSHSHRTSYPSGHKKTHYDSNVIICTYPTKHMNFRY